MAQKFVFCAESNSFISILWPDVSSFALNLTNSSKKMSKSPGSLPFRYKPDVHFIVDMVPGLNG